MARSAGSLSARGTGASIIVISSVAGLVAALAGGLVSAGDPPKLLVGAAIGLVVGALGALGVIAVVDHRAPLQVLVSEDGKLDRGAVAPAARRGGDVVAGSPRPSAPASGAAPTTVVADGAPATRPVRTERGGGAGGGTVVGTGPSGPARAGVGGGTTRPATNLEALVTSIGHRYQSLADRQLAALSELADHEPENGKLALATRLARRMRRASKTLQILADDPESREVAPDATIVDVITTAIADNDDHARIDYRSLHTAQVDGEVVPDLVHLLAELIDNAVSSSRSNGTSVTVLGRRSADAYILSVVDEGAGMAANQRAVANDRVQAPPALGQQSPAAFGLPTVGRLAARHDIAVTLLEAATDGVIAKVRLPARLLGGKGRDPGTGRAKDRPAVGAVGAGAAPGAEDTVIDLTTSASRPAAAVAAPAGAPSGATLSTAGKVRNPSPDPAARADLARQVQRNRSTAQEAPVRNQMQPASLTRPAEQGTALVRPSSPEAGRNQNRRTKDGGTPDGGA